MQKETMFWFQKQYTPRVEDQCKAEISPCYESNHSGLAPAFVLTAEFDPLLDDGRLYFEQLKAAGNKARYKEYPELVHGFINIPKTSPEAMKAFDDIKEFLDGVK